MHTCFAYICHCVHIYSGFSLNLPIQSLKNDAWIIKRNFREITDRLAATGDQSSSLLDEFTFFLFYRYFRWHLDSSKSITSESNTAIPKIMISGIDLACAKWVKITAFRPRCGGYHELLKIIRPHRSI